MASQSTMPDNGFTGVDNNSEGMSGPSVQSERAALSHIKRSRIRMARCRMAHRDEWRSDE